jgi:hypothetical protein
MWCVCVYTEPGKTQAHIFVVIFAIRCKSYNRKQKATQNIYMLKCLIHPFVYKYEEMKAHKLPFAFFVCIFTIKIDDDDDDGDHNFF